MTGEIQSSDNNGNRVPPGIMAADPIAASGIWLAEAGAAANHTQTVVSGATYVFTCARASSKIGMVFGIADATVAANAIWIATFAESCIIKIPDGVTTLHWANLTAGAAGMLRRLS
jgi:hypothetical protein